MLKRNKIEVIPFKEFMRGGTCNDARFEISRKQIKKLIVITGAVILSLGFGDVSMAAAGAVNAAITDRVVSAFDPLIGLVQALSYPIGLTVMLCGGIFMMVGSADRGLTMIQRAAAGYIAVQLLPMLMDLLVEVAKAL